MKKFNNKLEKQFAFEMLLKRAKRKYFFERKIKNICLSSALFLFAAITVGVAILICAFIVIRGLEEFHISMLWSQYHQSELETKGYTGVAGPLVSTLLIIFLVLLISIPVCLFTVILTTEFGYKKKWPAWINLFATICNGIPSIIFGMFGLVAFVYFIHFNRLGFSIMSCALTLCLVVMPTLYLGMHESVKKIPIRLKMNSYALGATRFQTVFRIIIPTAIAGIFSSIIAITSRAAGESAPVLFTVGGANTIPHSAFSSGNTLTLLLFSSFKNPQSESFLYSLAFIILLLIIFLNLFFKLLGYLFRFKNKKHVYKIDNKFIYNFLNNLRKYFKYEFIFRIKIVFFEIKNLIVFKRDKLDI